MSRSDLLLAFIQSGAGGDDPAFRRAADALIAEEENKKHGVLASQLADALTRRRPSTGANVTSLSHNEAPIGLLYEQEPERRFTDLVLPTEVRQHLNRLVEEHHRRDPLRSHGVEPRHRLLGLPDASQEKTDMACNPNVVQLRVHGVSGTPPEQLLETPHVLQFAGDEYSRFFVPVDCSGEPLRGALRLGSKETSVDSYTEGYHWGKYTSGSWRQGLWLALIPFGLMNASQFMLPRAVTTPQKFWHIVSSAILRILALGLTCTFALAVSTITIDLIARQSLSRTTVASALTPGVLLLVGQLAAAVVVLGIFWLGRQSRPIEMPNPEGTLGEQENLQAISGLARPQFYGGNPDAPSLARLHIAAAFVTIASISVLSAGLLGIPSWETLQLAPVWLFVALAAIVAVLGDPEGSAIDHINHEYLRRVRDGWRSLSGFLTWSALAGAGVYFILVGMAVAKRYNEGGASQEAVESVGNTFIVWLTAWMLLSFVTSGILAILTHSQEAGLPKPFRRYAFGLAAPIVATVAMFFGVGYSAGFVFATAEVLRVVDTPRVADRIALTWGFTVGLVASIAIWGLTASLLTHRKRLRRVQAAYGRASAYPDPVTECRWYRGIAWATSVARAKNHMACALGIFTAMGLVFSAWMVHDILFAVPGSMYSALPDDWVAIAVNIGAWALVGAAGFLLAAGRKSIREAYS